MIFSNTAVRGTSLATHSASALLRAPREEARPNRRAPACRLAAQCARHIQNRVRNLAEVAKEHSMPPRNPLPYILGYAASGALVAGVIYYNRAALIPRLRSVASWLREVCTDFSRVHVVEPVKNIYTELVYRYVLHYEHKYVVVVDC